MRKHTSLLGLVARSLPPLVFAAALAWQLDRQGTATLAAPAALEQAGWKLTPPQELFAIERVVDADTIHIRRNGAVQKLRLLSVDTEEKLATNSSDPYKPSTVFGEECAQWAVEFFRALERDGQPAKVGLCFPRGVEENDVYGRLLCYVLLPDGRNFNLLLVELGKSPYFNKYGNSEVCHAALLAAQARAQKAQLGIWNPATNAPKTAGAPAARRPYERLLPWWDARALAVESYRERRAKDPAHVAAAESPAELERALETGAKGGEVSVFASVERLFDEDDGSLTVLLRSGSKDKALRVRIPSPAREKFAALDLAHLSDEFRQNYVWVRGRVGQGPRGYQIECLDPAAWTLAGPEPASAPAAATR